LGEHEVRFEHESMPEYVFVFRAPSGREGLKDRDKLDGMMLADNKSLRKMACKYLKHVEHNGQTLADASEVTEDFEFSFVGPDALRRLFFRLPAGRTDKAG